MLGVLIVDDEAIVRMNLKSIIDWEKEGFFILGEAENGKAGLDLILREKPDIVITDIKMPVMDGLEMILEAGREYSGARYVVLSSYDEFALLKTAMNYGVTEYLLKLELTPAILKKTLEGQREILLREKDHLAGRDMSSAEKAACFLRRVLAGYDMDGEQAALKDILEHACPCINLTQLSCIAIRFSLINKGNSFREEDYLTIEKAAQSIINDITKSYFQGISFLADRGLCLFVYSPGESGAAAREMCGVIIEMLRQYLNLASAAGISSLEGCWKDSARLMIDAVRATEEVFFRGYGIIVYSSELGTETYGVFSSVVYDWEEPYRQALELRDTEKVKKIFQQIQSILRPCQTDTCSSPRVSRAEAFNLCFAVAGITLSALKKQSSQHSAFDENLYETIGVIETLEGLLEWTKSFEEKIIGFFDTLPEKSHEDQIVIDAKRYIVKNCRRPISLNSAAKDLAISAGYLSSVFKRRTNTSFVEYVTRVKIGEAKNLLLSGRYKVYEVSDMIGYDDHGYFSKIFHKVTGMSPGEFMKKHI